MNKQKITIFIFALLFTVNPITAAPALAVVQDPNQSQQTEEQPAPENSNNSASSDNEQVQITIQNEASESENNETINRRNINLRRQKQLEELQASKDRELSREQVQEKINDLKDKTQEARCEAIQANLLARADFYEENKQRHVQWHRTMHTNLEKALDKIDSLQLDTSELETAISTLEDKINTLDTQVNTRVDAMQTAAEDICTLEPEVKREQIQAFRQDVKEIRTTARELKAHYQEEIKPALQSLRQEAAQLGQEQTTESSISSQIMNN